MPCVAHLGEVSGNLAKLEAVGLSVLAVGHAPPEIVKQFIEREKLLFPIVTDPERVGYKSLGLGRVKLWHFLRPRILGNFLKLLFKGQKIRRLTWTEDVFQLGGDYIVDRNRKILFAYPSQDATDRPSIATILDAEAKTRGGS
jgi:AhpC/TSA antioxidant enzyme